MAFFAKDFPATSASGPVAIARFLLDDHDKRPVLGERRDDHTSQLLAARRARHFFEHILSSLDLSYFFLLDPAGNRERQ